MNEEESMANRLTELEKKVNKVIEGYADDVRILYDVEVPFSESIDSLIEKLGGNLETAGLDCYGDGKLYLRTETCEKLFKIRVRPSLKREVRNYEIARQIGHLFLHTTYVKSLAHEKELLITEDLSDTRSETEANIFADVLTMPEDEFTKEVKQNVHDGRVNMKKVAEKFGVIYDVAFARASRLNLIEW